MWCLQRSMWIQAGGNRRSTANYKTLQTARRRNWICHSKFQQQNWPAEKTVLGINHLQKILKWTNHDMNWIGQRNLQMGSRNYPPKNPTEPWNKESERVLLLVHRFFFLRLSIWVLFGRPNGSVTSKSEETTNCEVN